MQPRSTNEVMADSHQEQVIMSVLMAHLSKTDDLRPEEHEILAYRLAEIFVASKNLYTEALPALTEDDDADSDDVFEALGGLRMQLLHIRDLIEEFEEAMMYALQSRQKARDKDDEEDDDEDDDDASPPPVNPN